jgi:2-polyprenyl-3-methyl-5-hydroxy-6-metoxy-1,4-benzoquinol methylase
MSETPQEHPDERAYLYDDPELGVVKTDAEGKHWERWRNRYRKCIALAGRRGGAWMDVASGSGYGTQLIAEAADEVTGVDIDSTTVLYARKHHPHPRITYHNRSILDLAELMGSQFDVIISIETIEHVPDPTPFFESVRRMLKDDGVFVVTTPESQYGGGPNPLNRWHLHEFTREQLVAALETLFHEVRLETDTAVFNTGIETVQLYAICTRPRRG